MPVEFILISQLPAAAALTGTELIPLVQAGVTVRTPVSALAVAGIDGKNIELQTTATHLQWRITGGVWADLVALSTIDGIDGVDGIDGIDGRNLELQTTVTHIQWRAVGGAWANLVALSALKGMDGKNIELQTNATHIQWRESGGTWFDLIALAVLTGASGTTTWAGITDKPAAFAPSTHAHATSDVTGLDAALTGKAAATHTHVAANVTDLATTITTALTTERTATATLTGKTLTAPAITGAFTEQASAFVSSGTAHTIDLSTGTIKGLTLTGACVLTFPVVGVGKQFTLFLKQDATGSRLVTWPAATVRWAASAAPTLTTVAAKTDVIGFICDPSGTYWTGFVGGLTYTFA